MVVILNDETWEVEKFEKGGIWYAYNNMDAPILYRIYQRDPERQLVWLKPYTEFRDKDGYPFEDDISLQNYLDELLAFKEFNVSLDTTIRNGDSELHVKDLSTNVLLKELVGQLKVLNMHMCIITENDITEKDV